MRKLLMLGLVAAIASPVFAGVKTLDTDTHALIPNAYEERLGANYGTGFEAAEGFGAGYIGGQAGWTTFASSTAQPIVTFANPFAGSQAMRIANDPALAPGTLTGGFSPNQGALPAGSYTVSVQMNLSAIGGADYDVVPQAPSQGFLTARYKFSFLGDILVLDDTGGGLAFIDTGADWTADAGTYKEARIEVNAGANTIDYYWGGALVYSSVAGVFAGSSVEQVVLISDNWQNPGETGNFDNLNVTPEPATLALLAFGGLAMVRRRR
jgi:hypothetical protein